MFRMVMPWKVKVHLIDSIIPTKTSFEFPCFLPFHYFSILKKKYCYKMEVSPPKRLRMFEDNIDFDDLDLESESDYEGSDNDNEEDVLEVDDQEGKELLKNFLETNGDVPGLKENEPIVNDTFKGLEANATSNNVSDFVLDDVKKVNEENLRLLEEVQEMADELREKNKIIEQMKEAMEVSVSKLKELKQKDEDLKVLQVENKALEEDMRTKDQELVSLKSQLKMYDLLSTNWKKSAAETEVASKKMNTALQEKEKEVATLKNVLNELELNCQLKLESESNRFVALKGDYKKIADEYERKAEQMLNMINLQNEAIKRLKLKDRRPANKENSTVGTEKSDENRTLTDVKETNKPPPGPPGPQASFPTMQHRFQVPGPPGPPSTSITGPPTTSFRAPPGPLAVLGSVGRSTSPPGPFTVTRTKSPPGPSIIDY